MSIKENLEEVKQSIANTAIKVGKIPEDIILVMATKTVAPERIREAIQAGGHIVAENKVQEALKKYEVLKREEAEWHFIGHLQPAKRWLDVTEEIGFVRRRHGQDWVVLGRAFHRLFEGLSRGTLWTKTVETKISDILRNETLSDSALERMRGIIIADLVRLEQSGYLQDIILAADNAHAELPFVLQKGDRIYRGRVDRLIIREGVAHLYDYKTYPVSEKEIPELCER